MIPLTAVTRGIALGAWILTGAAFVMAAAFPGSTGATILGPMTLTGALLWTALLKSHQRGALPVHSTPALLLGSVLLTTAVALTIVHAGDRRSFLVVAFIAVATIALAWGGRSPAVRTRGYNTSG